MSMWEPYTERARRAVVLAQEEAQRLGNNYIGTEHMLLGIISEGENLAAKFLKLTLTQVRTEVENIVGRGDKAPQHEMVFTPRGKRVIELAFEEARKLNHAYIGTEHLLLGILVENEGVGARTLHNLLGDNVATAERLRESVRAEQAKPKYETWVPTKAEAIEMLERAAEPGYMDEKKFRALCRAVISK